MKTTYNMSVNQIDINAVNKRAKDHSCGCGRKECSGVTRKCIKKK